MSESEFFILHRGKTKGPFTQSQVIKLAKQGKISAESNVRKGATGNWHTAGKIRGLQPYLNAGLLNPEQPKGVDPAANLQLSHSNEPVDNRIQNTEVPVAPVPVDSEFKSDSDAFSAVWGQLKWSNWIDLGGSLSTFQSHIPKGPGFYRIRSQSTPGLIYVGQTGRSLRARTRCLAKGVFADADSPPWNDPHTAAALLWAYHHENSFDFEVSAAEAHLEKQMQQCHEDYLLYLHRLQFGHSTLANHGRLHPLWTRPSNKRDGRAATRRETGKEYPSLPPARGDLNPIGSNWLDLSWTSFRSSHEVQAQSLPGVYRIRQGERLVYVGQSMNLQSRLRTHGKAARFVDCLFSLHEMPGAESHQLQEREADLIGAHFKTLGVSPVHQYKPS